MTVPQGRLLQDDPSPSSNTAVIVSHGDRRGDIVVSCIRVAAGAKTKEQVRRVWVDLRVWYTRVRIIYDFNKYEVY